MSQFDVFSALHHSDNLLCLPNAWDAGSAKIFEGVGASAIATTSAGVAWAQGYADGRVLPAEVAVEAARTIARVLTVPLSFDVEHGYSDDPEVVADNVLRLAEAGVAGINIEDGRDAPSLLAKKIEAIKRRLLHAGVNVFVNARTDVYLASLVEDGQRLDEVIARGTLYRAAGADGVFVPTVKDNSDIQRLAAAVTLPLNVMAWPGLPMADTLQELGVRRLSAGSGISQAVWGQARALAKDFLANGNSAPLSENAMSFADLQTVFR